MKQKMQFLNLKKKEEISKNSLEVKLLFRPIFSRWRYVYFNCLLSLSISCTLRLIWSWSMRGYMQV